METRPQFYFRPEHAEWDFVEDRARAFDGLIVLARYLAEYPVGHLSFGKSADRLATAADAAKRPLVVDPDTPGLCSKGILRYRSARRLCETPAASAVVLPLAVEDLRNRDRRSSFVDACAEGQAQAWALAAPYLDFRNVHDERFALSLQMLERVASSAGSQIPVGFAQATVTRLMSGELARAASRLAATGAEIIFTRVRGLHAEKATSDQLDAYADLIGSIKRAGADAVPDCVGRLGPFLVAADASAFSGGAHHFRRVGQPLLAAGGGGGGGGGEPLTLELSSGGETARGGSGGGSAGSPSASASASLDDLRERRLTIWRTQGRDAAANPIQFLETMRHSGDAISQLWATTLLKRAERAA